MDGKADLYEEDGLEEGDDGDDPWAADLAALDAALARTDRVLAGDLTIGRPGEANSMPRWAAGSKTIPKTFLLYEDDWDEAERLTLWRKTLADTETLPPVLAAVLALDAWEVIGPLQHDASLGRLLTSAILRRRDKTRAHLACLNVGLRAVSRERRRAAGPTTRLLARIEAITAAAERGFKDHDRWLLVRTQLERKLVGRRSTSRLPALIELILATPVASAGLIAAQLGVTPRAAQDMVAELGLREVTGRGDIGPGVWFEHGDRGSMHQPRRSVIQLIA